jgi:hypothetical protein
MERSAIRVRPQAALAAASSPPAISDVGFLARLLAG